jgi:dihydroorotate dehydrogenase
MRLHGIEFGRVMDASGVRGFFGEGYRHHRPFAPFGLRFAGSTFVAKTTTLPPRAGNMALDARWRPSRLMPDCIRVLPFKGAVLNAVGLSGPGAAALFADGRWQRREEPFFLSFAMVGASPRERLDELRGFVDLYNEHRGGFHAPTGLQINFSCPNAGSHAAAADEIAYALSVAARLNIPLIPKFSVAMPVEAAAAVAKTPWCDAVCVSNTVPWGSLPEAIDWKGLFGTDRSPLARYGGGGLSGRPLLPLVAEWVGRARNAGLAKPLVAGGGILGPSDARALLAAGADAIFIGSIAILRPWRLAATIRAAAEH